MRTSSRFLGLAAPVLIAFAFFAMAIPQAVAQTPTSTVSGTVVSDAGEPLAGANVAVYTFPADGKEPPYDSRGDATTTGPDGAFKLSVPAGKGYLNVYYDQWRASAQQDVDLTSGDVSGIVVTLKSPPPKTAIVEGRVVDANGAPVEGAEVRLEMGGGCCIAYDTMPAVDAPPSDASATTSASGGAGSSGAASSEPATSSIAPSPGRYPCCYDYESPTMITGADGKFSFKTYAGPRQIVAQAKGFAQTTLPVEAKENQTVATDVTLEKIPAKDAAVSGRVLDAQTGAVLGRAQVSVRSLEWSRWANDETGADGSYRLLALPGWTEISVSYYQYPEPVPLAEGGMEKIARVPDVQYYTYTTIVDLRSGENEVDVKLVPKPKPSVALVGYVVDPETKKAVPGATVNVWNMDAGDWGSATTDATGSFRILVRPGQFQANAWKEGYLGGSQTFEVEDAATQRIDVLLPSGTQKWVPCYSDDDCGYVLYKEASTDSASVTARVAQPASAPQAEGADAGATGLGDANAAGFGAQTGKGAAYQGEGGGLPAYEPEATSAVGERAAPVPGLGVLALLGAAAAVALLARRR